MPESKKNWIPLILAVIVSFVAVLGVKQLIQKKTAVMQEERIDIVKTIGDMKSGDTLTRENIEVKSIPVSARPPRSFTAKQVEILYGQQLVRDLPAGSYIQMDDVSVDSSIDDAIGDGKWAISVSLNGGAICRRLRPGNEIAIVGTFDVMEETKEQSSEEKKPVVKRRKVTTVILPRVKILYIDSEYRQGSDEFILALNPEEAQVLIAAQNQGVELAPALRKVNDGTNLNRISTKLVDKETFNKLVRDIETVEIPVSTK